MTFPELIKHLRQQKRQERRDLLNAYRGAQDALRTLKGQEDGRDYASMLAQCQERIAELEGRR